MGKGGKAKNDSKSGKDNKSGDKSESKVKSGNRQDSFSDSHRTGTLN